MCDLSPPPAHVQDRAFLGLTTLKDLVLRRPQGPQGSEDFLQAILEVTMSNLELVRREWGGRGMEGGGGGKEAGCRVIVVCDSS